MNGERNRVIRYRRNRDVGKLIEKLPEHRSEQGKVIDHARRCGTPPTVVIDERTSQVPEDDHASTSSCSRETLCLTIAAPLALTFLALAQRAQRRRRAGSP